MRHESFEVSAIWPDSRSCNWRQFLTTRGGSFVVVDALTRTQLPRSNLLIRHTNDASVLNSVYVCIGGNGGLIDLRMA